MVEILFFYFQIIPLHSSGKSKSQFYSSTIYHNFHCIFYYYKFYNTKFVQKRQNIKKKVNCKNQKNIEVELKLNYVFFNENFLLLFMSDKLSTAACLQEIYNENALSLQTG